MTFVWRILIWLLCWGPVFAFASSARSQASFGPLYETFQLTLSPGERTEVLGPLFSSQEIESERTRTWTPALSYRLDEATDVEEWDFLYPALTYDRFGSEYRFQIGQLLSLSGGQYIAGETRKRLTLFPIYFQQRSSDPSLNYTAFVPFYGHLKNRLFRDEVKFILMPLYVQSRKRDVVTDNYLFPLFHLRRGDSLRGWQFWPLIGREEKKVTYRTNSLDELEVVGGHKKFNLLWPLFFHNELAIGTDNPKTEDLLLPFYSRYRSPNRDSSTYLWPLFTFTNDREKQYREFDFAGPLVVFARGPGKTANRIWPLFSHVHNESLTSSFYLWPLYKFNRAYAPPLDRRRTRICLFLYSDVIEEDIEKHTAVRRTDLWPLFTARRDRNGNERLQILALAEPFLPKNKGFERSYSPLWSLWRSEKNGQTGATSQSLLWNLYRRETTPNTKKCSFLFGLFRYESAPAGKRVRLFYIPLGKGKAKSRAASPEAE